MAKISGDGITVNFDVVLSEKVQRSASITSSPVEVGTDMQDHVYYNPNILVIQGVCTTDGANKIANLSTLYRNAALCEYIGRNWDTNAVITKLDSDHPGSIDKGFSFQMELTLVRISNTQHFAKATQTTNAENSAQIKLIDAIGNLQPVQISFDTQTVREANTKAWNSIKLFG